ncbi:hypothetical protein GS582_13285 [Rhodococcus hoagii]|nr:hypothetical protein [Prescottella equi]
MAGTVSTDSALRVEITAVGEDTALAGIQRLVAEAQNSSSRAQVLADRAAALLFWFALGAAVITLLVWSIFGTPDEAITRTITVLVIACPHALAWRSRSWCRLHRTGARAGVLITTGGRSRRCALSTPSCFDKTGTLTRVSRHSSPPARYRCRRGHPRRTRRGCGT